MQKNERDSNLTSDSEAFNNLLAMSETFVPVRNDKEKKSGENFTERHKLRNKSQLRVDSTDNGNSTAAVLRGSTHKQCEFAKQPSTRKAKKFKSTYNTPNSSSGEEIMETVQRQPTPRSSSKGSMKLAGKHQVTEQKNSQKLFSPVVHEKKGTYGTRRKKLLQHPGKSRKSLKSSVTKIGTKKNQIRKSIHDTYSTVEILVDISQVKVGAETVRAEQGLSSYRNYFKTIFSQTPNSYNDNNSLISVYIPELCNADLEDLLNLVLVSKRTKLVNIHRLPRKNSKLALRIMQNGVFFIDGIRRGIALKDEKVLSIMEGAPNLKALLYYRLDKKPMRGHDRLRIGGVLNSCDDLNREMTTIDRIHLVNSYLRHAMNFKLDEELPCEIEDDCRISEIIENTRTNPNALRSSDICYLIITMGLLPSISQTQTRTISIVAMGVFQFHDENHRERLLFPLIATIPLRILMHEFVWKCDSLCQQLFVLHGIRSIFLRRMKDKFKDGSDSENNTISKASCHRPRNITKTHYLDIAIFLRAVWNKVVERLCLPRNMSGWDIIEDSDSADALPWEANVSIRKCSFRDILALMMEYSLSDLLAIANQKSETSSWSETWVSMLEEHFDPVYCEAQPKIAQQKIKPIEKSTKSCTECEFDVDNSSPYTTKNKILKVSSVRPTFKCTKINSDNQNQSISQPKRIPDTTKDTEVDNDGEHSTEKSRKERELKISGGNVGDEDSRWKLAKKILDELHDEFREERNDPATTVDEEGDENGFQITNRSSAFCSYLCPRVRGDGVTNLRRETLESYECVGYIPKDHELWWEGDLTSLESGEKFTIRLFEDNDRGFSTLNPSFKLDGTLKKLEPEIVIPRLSQIPIPSKSESKWCSNPRIQVILRSLGFRPPHRSFFTNFSLNDYIQLRESLLASILKQNIHQFICLRNICAAQSLESIESEGIELIEEIVQNFFKSLRDRLDLCGIVILNSLFSTLKNSAEQTFWPGQEHTIETDLLHTKAKQFSEYWMGTLPSVSDIQQHLCTTNQFLLWSSVRNSTKNEKAQIHAKARLMNTKYAATTYYEEAGTRKERISVLKSKCFLEIAVMQIAAWMRLNEDNWNETDGKPENLYHKYKTRALSAPDTGGRMIAMASVSTRRQVGHRDLPFSTGEPIASNGSSLLPPYFSIVTFNETVPFWVAEDSHKYLHKSFTDMKKLGNLLPLRLIYIPPWSLLLVRGDVMHAGGSGHDVGGRNAPRFHMYLLRKGTAFGDMIDHSVGKYFRFHESDKVQGQRKRMRFV